MRALFVLAALLLVVGACARATTPSGGDVPETPPPVVETFPDTFQILEPFRGPVRIEFERTLSERLTTGTLRDAVVVSPRTGEVEVRLRRNALEVAMEGGFRERTVYRVTVLPVLQDRYRNRLARPFELFFSTGPEFEPNLVAGLVTDRLTADEVAGARIDARPLPEGPVHSTVSDSLGVFSFRFLPEGSYRVVAYEDRNRNRRPDFAEPQDSIEVGFTRGDTVIVTELALLQPDTTAAVARSATLRDSVTVEVVFDDHLDPDGGLVGVSARLEREDEGPVPSLAEVMHGWQWERLVAEREAREREAAAEAPDPDAPDPEEPAEPAFPGEPEPVPDGPPLPGQSIIFVFSAPLEPGMTYTVTVTGVENIHGIPGGGGEVELEVPEPPEDPEDPAEDPPDRIPPDTSTAREAGRPAG